MNVTKNKKAIRVIKREIRVIEKRLKHGVKIYGVDDKDVIKDNKEIQELLNSLWILENVEK